MTDSVTVTNFPVSGSQEQVAYDMAKFIVRSVEDKKWKDFSRVEFLDLVSECRRALCVNKQYK